ncbi:hypothetical protein AU825_16465 [Salmonella enterica subsp. salamae]|nr:hypothetical protein [Salmonella enterica subsp. salamae]EDW5992135.1 hypothetical protein [Salmonella enterica subsp. salamae]
MVRIIKDIFHPSPRDILKRSKFVIYTLSSWMILFTIMPKKQYLDLMFIIINTYIHINIAWIILTTLLLSFITSSKRELSS